MCKWLISLVVLALPIFGCEGAPRFGYNDKAFTPANTAQYGRFKISIPTNGEFIATGVKAGSAGLFERHFNADSLIMRPSIDAMWAGIHGSQDRFAVLQDRYFTGINDALDRIPPIINAVAPIATSWINSTGNVALQRALRPTLIQQLAGGVLSGRVQLPTIDGAFNALDPRIVTDVAEAVKTATSQPTK